MAGLEATWDFLSDFQQRGTLALYALRAQAAQTPWGVASNGRILDEPRLRSMEEMYLPAYGRKDAVPAARMAFARKPPSDNGSSSLRRYGDNTATVVSCPGERKNLGPTACLWLAPG